MPCTFDGDPTRITEEEITDEGETTTTTETTPEGEELPPEAGPDIIEPPSGEPRKFYYDGGQKLDPNGRQLRVVRYTDYAAETVRTMCPSAQESRDLAGRPRVDRELRDLIRRMTKENPLWGAPRIHGELLKLGFDVAQSTVSKYMARRQKPPSQTWKTFLRSHGDAIAAIDLCVVPTATFERLFAFLIVGQGRRLLLWFAVQPCGTIVATPILSGLHHRYARI
jgi:hypothetical protein